jgi:hypothetical protein
MVAICISWALLRDGIVLKNKDVGVMIILKWILEK